MLLLFKNLKHQFDIIHMLIILQN